MKPATAWRDAENARKRRALDYLDAHPEVRRACFSDSKALPGVVLLTVALRKPAGAVEIAIRRECFDEFALIELGERYPDTSIFLNG